MGGQGYDRQTLTYANPYTNPLRVYYEARLFAYGGNYFKGLRINGNATALKNALSRAGFKNISIRAGIVNGYVGGMPQQIGNLAVTATTTAGFEIARSQMYSAVRAASYDVAEQRFERG